MTLPRSPRAVARLPLHRGHFEPVGLHGQHEVARTLCRSTSIVQAPCSQPRRVPVKRARPRAQQVPRTIGHLGHERCGCPDHREQAV